ncbi:cyclin-like protein, partial [Jimgerdemannia flammicorona]
MTVKSRHPKDLMTVVIERQNKQRRRIKNPNKQDETKVKSNKKDSKTLVWKIENTRIAAKVQMTEKVSPIFEEDEYSKEISIYMKTLEMKYLPNPNYIDFQCFPWSTRKSLINWLVDIHAKYKLLPETLFLCVHLIDRLLSKQQVHVSELRLVGITTLLIAAKFEEHQHLPINMLVNDIDIFAAEEHIRKTERDILHQLDFGLTWPGPIYFLKRCCEADKNNLQMSTLAQYLIELTLIDERLLKWPSSQIAAVGYLVAMNLMQQNKW